MRRALRRLMIKFADEENNMCSVFWKTLPFRVEPAEMRVVFSCDGAGGRHCHIDVVEKKPQEVHEVQMMEDEDDNNNVPASAKKMKYKTKKSF